MAELVAREREFSANASHQLRTPLTALRIQLEELAAFADDPAIVRADATTALAQADVLDATITELLTLARHGQMSAPINVDATRLVADRSRAWTAAFNHAHRPLAVEPSAPLMVSTSPAALGQCLDVLLDNALHHGAGVVTVRVESVGSGGSTNIPGQSRMMGSRRASANMVVPSGWTRNVFYVITHTADLVHLPASRGMSDKEAAPETVYRYRLHL